MGNEELARLAAQRSGLFWLLSELVLHHPDGKLAESPRNGLEVRPEKGAQGAIVDGLRALRDALPPPGDAVASDALAAEHARLFGGLKSGYGLPPAHESVHRGAATPTDVYTDVLACYASAGFGDLREPAAPPDHLGVELKFIALLCHKEMGAWRAGASVEAIDTLRQQRNFLDAHLLNWMPRFWRLVQARAEHPFYRTLAAFALDAVAEDRALLEEMLVEHDLA
jgi:TorA maturation chaperone TorD